jgi:hypothetical protein
MAYQSVDVGSNDEILERIVELKTFCLETRQRLLCSFAVASLKNIFGVVCLDQSI